MPPRALLAAIALAGLLLPVAPAGSAGPEAPATGPARGWDLTDDNHGDCNMLMPASTTTAQVPTKTSPIKTLDVLILVERVDLAATQANLAVAARSYAPLGIKLQARYRR